MKSDAILMVNMGGPAGTDEIRPYLKEIFRDPLILPVPGWLRGAVGNMIVSRRLDKVTKRYESIGGASPLLMWTEALTREVREMAELKGQPRRIEFAYRYSRPVIPEAIETMRAEGVESITLLPLFPHYTRAMTGSVQIEATRAATRQGVILRPVPAWGLHPAILELQTRYLREAVKEAGEGARVLFVAHGIPVRNVRRGDPYTDQVRRTAVALANSLPRDMEWTLAYQSRLGPVKWTEPYLEDELARFTQSSDPIVVMPLSFVADCLETLYDLDDVARKQAERAGVARFVRVPAFNSDARFAEALLEIVKEIEDEA
ncbi:ferrochelatase [bacterium]|nr:ferrochelatase [bacterium]